MTTGTTHLTATDADLDPAVAAALAAPPAGRRSSTRVGAVALSSLEWLPDPARATGRSVLLLHGVTNSARGWWRIGPALAAAGHRVVALDSPAHGMSRGWEGGATFGETAALVARYASAAGLDEARLAVIGHSWGSMIAAELPTHGLRPARIVLLDPPALTEAETRGLLDEGARTLPPPAEARAAIAAEHPDWHPEDVAAKAEQLAAIDRERVPRIILGNAWDGAVGAIGRAVAAGYPGSGYRIVRGLPALGGMLPDPLLPRLAALVGADGIVTLEGAGHSPQRTHPAALVLAFLRAIG